MSLQLQQFLAEAYRLSQLDERRPGVRHIFTQMNDWLCQGEFDLCDLALDSVDLLCLNVDMLMAFLVITNAARDKLKKRANFYERAFGIISTNRGKRFAKIVLGNLA